MLQLKIYFVSFYFIFIYLIIKRINDVAISAFQKVFHIFFLMKQYRIYLLKTLKANKSFGDKQTNRMLSFSGHFRLQNK